MALNWISPNYFATYGTPLMAGRDFRDADVKTADFRVAVDGSLIEFEDYSSSERIRFDVRNLRLTELGSEPFSLQAPEIFGELVQKWQNSEILPTVRPLSLARWASANWSSE